MSSIRLCLISWNDAELQYMQIWEILKRIQYHRPIIEANKNYKVLIKLHRFVYETE